MKICAGKTPCGKPNPIGALPNVAAAEVATSDNIPRVSVLNGAGRSGSSRETQWPSSKMSNREYVLDRPSSLELGHLRQKVPQPATRHEIAFQN
jgi:hypothetical protein